MISTENTIMLYYKVHPWGFSTGIKCGQALLQFSKQCIWPREHGAGKLTFVVCLYKDRRVRRKVT